MSYSRKIVDLSILKNGSRSGPRDRVRSWCIAAQDFPRWRRESVYHSLTYLLETTPASRGMLCTDAANDGYPGSHQPEQGTAAYPRDRRRYRPVEPAPRAEALYV